MDALGTLVPSAPREPLHRDVLVKMSDHSMRTSQSLGFGTATGAVDRILKARQRFTPPLSRLQTAPSGSIASSLGLAPKKLEAPPIGKLMRNTSMFDIIESVEKEQGDRRSSNMISSATLDDIMGTIHACTSARARIYIYVRVHTCMWIYTSSSCHGHPGCASFPHDHDASH